MFGDLERPLKMLQSASDLVYIILRRGRTDLNLWSIVLLKMKFYHCGVDHPSIHPIFMSCFMLFPCTIVACCRLGLLMLNGDKLPVVFRLAVHFSFR
jgi:hypothetical protein